MPMDIALVYRLVNSKELLEYCTIYNYIILYVYFVYTQCKKWIKIIREKSVEKMKNDVDVCAVGW